MDARPTIAQPTSFGNMALLITQNNELAFLSLSTDRKITSKISLGLPARFPLSDPLPAVSTSTGHVFLYSTSSPIIWEYDAKGRRVSEFSLPALAVKVLVLVSAKHSERLVCAFQGGAGSWKKSSTWEIESTINVLAPLSRGTRVLMASDVRRRPLDNRQ
jgi:hypothetical protein